ncbi:Bifunctional pinoresinol-lariciresinol reductase [Euphorbia peplus]|nr:Bifunctional pinoresinol-lariciresinol reductase [Euphorbia peplus]
MEEKSKVLIIGGSGYLGKRLVKACLGLGHQTYIFQRAEIGATDIEKVQKYLRFKKRGAVSGVHIRTHQILLQLKLVEAIKEAGNVKRFLPSEFGTDPARMDKAMEPGRVTFDDKMVIRKAIEEAQIPFTYVSANCFAGYFLGGLCQPGHIIPSRNHVTLLGDGDQKAVFVDENDIATYTVMTIDDPRTLNKTLYIRPPKNVLSQKEVVEVWETLIGKELDKSCVSEEDFLLAIKGEKYEEQVGLTHYYHVCYEGCLTNFKIGDQGEEATQLYPQVNYTTVSHYLTRFL